MRDAFCEVTKQPVYSQLLLRFSFIFRIHNSCTEIQKWFHCFLNLPTLRQSIQGK
jgi:hypothetical protein